MPFRAKPYSKHLFETDRPSAPPREGYIVAHIDGGARGNPGPAGYGVYIEDAKGKVLAELSVFLGRQTNNVAEYSGLIAALEFALKNACLRVRIVSDSELLVKQMRGEYKVKSPDLRPLYERARALTAKLEWHDIKHVLRSQNREADRLANAAMDEGLEALPNARGPLMQSLPIIERNPGSTMPGHAVKEYAGIVRGGVVELIKAKLPEGTRVVVRELK